MLKLGRKLKTLRKINNFTPKFVCEQLQKTCDLKFTPAAIYKWEENVVEPNIYALLALAKIYNTSISFILGDTIVELRNLKRQEIRYLELFRHDLMFMHIANLSMKYLERNQRLLALIQKND